MQDIGLVLEGGGMKGLYTAGALEFFMEQELYFPYVIGVSAGACMAASYLSRQKDRNRKVNIDFVDDARFISYSNLWKKRQLFGMDFIFDEIPNKLVPFDFDTFLSSKEELVVGTTDCATGKPVYYTKAEDGHAMLTLIRASSSLPFVAPSVSYKDKHLLDGGISDPIPVKKARADGFSKNVVVMTKPKDYRKKRSKFSSVMKMIYRKYPKISEQLNQRYVTYNDTLDFMEEEKQNDRLFVIQPSVDLEVSRAERDPAKLTSLYKLGYEDAKKQYASLQYFLNSHTPIHS
ncbi:patatin-like phospholipase family protein [Aquibacillus sediminis]|uniref:patatin-like phospholipase family protein n=1 Tax=Aquibacillus sediminis TaxID=2574734 RepID=UPI001108957B|nr:patatin family protein [Aquibacillus sediminis]